MAPASPASACLPARQAPLPSGRRRRVAGIAAGCAALALGPLSQRYWPAFAGEPAARQLALLKAMLTLPLLLSLDRLRGRHATPPREGPRR